MSTILVVTSNKPESLETVKSVTESKLDDDEWTIDNKYYMATVKFLFKSTVELSADGQGLESAAIIYLFDGNKDFFSEFAPLLQSQEPEVLAVLSPQYDSDKNDELDDFFGEHGFEYIPIYPDGKAPRLIDALSTIMWPNMTRKTDFTSRQPRSPNHDLVEPFGSDPEDDNFLDLDTNLDIDIDEETLEALGRSLLQAKADAKPLPGTSEYQSELDALERWLEEGDTPRLSDRATSPPGASYSQLSDSLGTSSVPESSADLTFDDDFSPFVSAPPLYNPSDPTPPPAGDDDTLDPDPELPSPAEILQASREIFGPSIASNRPDNFDLTSILNSLQNMKEEVSQITDEDEKRKAAARVALGLVWALEGEK